MFFWRFLLWKDTDMQVYWVKDVVTGDAALLGSKAVEKIIGVEISYVEWCIDTDGLFENGRWRV